MSDHIDFFKYNCTDRIPKRFTDVDNMPVVPDRHKERMKYLLNKACSLGEGQVGIFTFHIAGEASQHFRWVTRDQFDNLKKDINWKGTRQQPDKNYETDGTD